MKRLAFGTIALALLLAAPVSAQDATPPIIVAEYLRCSMTQQGRATEIASTMLGPIIQKHIDAGHLTGWGWRNHLLGGGWRSLRSIVGTDLDMMMDVRGQINQEFRAQHAAEAAELATICGSHDDYIWIGVSNSTPNPNAAPAPASLSTYYVCDNAREARADEIFATLMAPLYQKHAEMGHLGGWGFYRHRLGGQFRRLETFSGADAKTLLSMQAAIYGEANTADPLAFSEFRQICGTHTDYIWMDPTP